MGALLALVASLSWTRRERACRQRGHEWSERTDPICCGRCGAMRTHRTVPGGRPDGLVVRS
jgi:hypothetical protein